MGFGIAKGEGSTTNLILAKLIYRWVKSLVIQFWITVIAGTKRTFPLAALIALMRLLEDWKLHLRCDKRFYGNTILRLHIISNYDHFQIYCFSFLYKRKWEWQDPCMRRLTRFKTGSLHLNHKKRQINRKISRWLFKLVEAVNIVVWSQQMINLDRKLPKRNRNIAIGERNNFQKPTVVPDLQPSEYNCIISNK